MLITIQLQQQTATWPAGSGDVQIKSMDDYHLANALTWCETRMKEDDENHPTEVRGYTYEQWVRMFTEEQCWREANERLHSEKIQLEKEICWKEQEMNDLLTERTRLIMEKMEIQQMIRDIRKDYEEAELDLKRLRSKHERKYSN